MKAIVNEESVSLDKISGDFIRLVSSCTSIANADMTQMTPATVENALKYYHSCSLEERYALLQSWASSLHEATLQLNLESQQLLVQIFHAQNQLADAVSSSKEEFATLEAEYQTADDPGCTVVDLQADVPEEVSSAPDEPAGDDSPCQ